MPAAHFVQKSEIEWNEGQYPVAALHNYYRNCSRKSTVQNWLIITLKPPFKKTPRHVIFVFCMLFQEVFTTSLDQLQT